jgi:PAS domain S-box-containing protein
MKRQSKTKHAASASQLDFQSLLDKIPAGAYTCDREGLITYFNRHAVELWGREPKRNDPTDRFCGSFRLFAVDGTPLRHNQCWMALALQTGDDYNRQEIIVERPDGTRRHALAHASPIRNAANEIVGAINVLVDISDLKRAEEASILLASVVESSDDAIVCKTLQGQILSWNDGAQRVFGFSAAEAVGQSITIIIPPERLPEEQMILDRLRKGERIDHYETVRVAKDGRRLHISVTISPLRDSTGRIFGASKIARDITARKRDETDLRRLHAMSLRLAATRDLGFILEETLRTAVAIEETDLGLLAMFDPGSDDLTVAATLGLDQSFFHSEGFRAVSGAYRLSFAQRRRVIVEDCESDVSLIPVRDALRAIGIRSVHNTPLVTRTGETVGVLSTYFRTPHRPSERVMRLVDLCAHQAVEFIENARLYDQLRLADRHKDEFLATLAHELRNPLGTVRNALHLLRLSDDLSPSVEHVRAIMDRQVNYMVSLVDDLLEVSRIARGKIELRLEPTDVSSILASAVETSRPLIEASDHQLTIQISPTPMTVNADSVRLVQVMVNLLNNAARYTNPGGQIWLTAHRIDGEAVLSVRDTGTGIPPNMLEKVFDMFAEGAALTEPAARGLGIGLALAKRLVEMHDGRIEARSEGPGKGSEFIVFLPLAPRVSPTLAPAAPSVAETPLPKRRVLIVDDTQAAIYVLGKLLAKLGQDVHAAQDAVSALQYAIRERPDMVITDISMPEMNGYELAKRLRREAGLEELVLVALTGYEDESHRRQMIEAGFDSRLLKPVSLDALRELLTELPSRGKATASPDSTLLGSYRRLGEV